MKTYGDMPQDHAERLKEMDTLLDFLMLNKEALPHLKFSKSMVCIAHHYFQMDMEEEGEKYLKFAADHSPGYFMAPMFSETKKDELFDHLVHNLTENSFALKVMTDLGFEYE